MSGTRSTGHGPDNDSGAGTAQGGEAPVSEETTMDPQVAVAIMQTAAEHAKSELTPNGPAIFAGWALAFLLCNGVIWLAVRGQRPYLGPPGWALGVVAGLVLLFVVGYAAVLNRAASGVGGVTARSRRIVYLSVVAGLVAVFAIEGGLRSSGASAGTTSLVGASGPILVYGLVCAGYASAWRQRVTLILGLWLMAVAVGSVFAGAATAWGVDAVAPAAGILVALAVRRARPVVPGSPGRP